MAEEGAAEEQEVAGPEGADEDREAGPARPKPSRRTMLLLVVPILVVVASGFVANAFFPTLSTKHPLLLIALDARNRFLVLARHVDLVPFVIVAVLRRSFSDPLFYLLGRFYGDNAVRWLQKKGGGGELVRSPRSCSRRRVPDGVRLPRAPSCAPSPAQTGMTRSGSCHQPGRHRHRRVRRPYLQLDIASPVEGLLGFFRRHLVATTAVSVGSSCCPSCSTGTRASSTPRTGQDRGGARRQGRAQRRGSRRGARRRGPPPPPDHRTGVTKRFLWRR